MTLRRHATLASVPLLGLILTSPTGAAAQAGPAVLLLASGATAAGTKPGSILASYSFEDEIATGPDTFRIFEHAKGTVSLTPAFHVSGYRAIEIKDVAGDRDMPEIQGYFPARDRGRLYAHFSFLTATPEEEFNIALAGPAWFRIRKDGIAFWLKSMGGTLVHYSDSIPKRLFRLEAFVWYTADVAYDIAAGSYDLTIRQEGREDPIVSLLRQRNAPNQPGSAVDKFSFVGEPFGDSSNVTYYADDIVIGVDEKIVQQPFVAPGRRKLFVDRFTEYEKLLRQRPRCLPAAGLADLGLTAPDVSALARDGLLEALGQLLSGGTPDLHSSQRTQGDRGRRFQAIAEWSQGCVALEAGNPQKALDLFTRAAERAPEGRIYELSSILALVGLKRIQEADERIGLIYAGWREDTRYAVVSAIVGTARGDLEKAEAWLREPAEKILLRGGSATLRSLRSGGINREVLLALRREFPDAWRGRLEEAMVSEQYYYVLLWNDRFDLARDYALRMVERLKILWIPIPEWLERAADAAFYARDLAEARQLYEQALKLTDRQASLHLKLSDIAFLSGEMETEKALREKIYGALEER